MLLSILSPGDAKPAILLAGKLFPNGRHKPCWQDFPVVPTKTSPNKPDEPAIRKVSIQSGNEMHNLKSNFKNKLLMRKEFVSFFVFIHLF